jgi:predicted RNA methylase
MPDPVKTAASLRKVAAKAAQQAEEKRAPRYVGMNITRRRAAEIEGLRKDAESLDWIEHKLLALADAFEGGTVPPILAKVTSRVLVENLRWYESLPTSDWAEKTLKRFIAADLDTDAKVKQAHDALHELGGEAPKEDPEEAKLRKLETEARLNTGNGWFWTPKKIADRIIYLSNIYAGLKVLEPSAGIGDLLAPVQNLGVIDLEVIELSPSRQEVLRLKGFQVVGYDFLEHEGEYDRIIMNPPFENGADIDHLRHAWECLAPGGRIVCIMCEGPFFRSDRKSEDFREWLDGVHGESETLPEGAFKEAGTGVNTRVVVIDKPGQAKRGETVEVPGCTDMWLIPFKTLDCPDCKKGLAELREIHRKAVKDALHRGEVIPLEIQKEYPDLFPPPCEPGISAEYRQLNFFRDAGMRFPGN